MSIRCSGETARPAVNLEMFDLWVDQASWWKRSVMCHAMRTLPSDETLISHSGLASVLSQLIIHPPPLPRRPTRSTSAAKLVLALMSWPSYVPFCPSTTVSKVLYLVTKKTMFLNENWRQTLEQAQADGCYYDKGGNPVSCVWKVRGWEPHFLLFYHLLYDELSGALYVKWAPLFKIKFSNWNYKMGQWKWLQNGTF